ncbi:MAG: ABC-F family ATP-binding cassette domain-containing protein [Candidatus Microsaccharimonas sossegonensis]|uniref:ABC-F family ATP-binding cassette domain-containing protein n=1 Tax=Candidatus Microsaccharimonas sossegonensis TaxID=2506948 RepID=A0A4Q0AI05_9BACT|nr:MAG: ABC-F family ATP-binding cassette domain-containing protein [Candidatus Microsaccharimonas sossegonensis]
MEYCSLLHVKDLGYEVDGHEVFRNVSFSVNKKDRIGLVGKNGAGKTTLLRAMAGQVLPNHGMVVRDNVEVGFMPQSLESWHDVSVFDFLESVTGFKQARQAFVKTFQHQGFFV